MKNYHFYFWSQLELTEYDNFSIIPENIVLIKSNYLNKSFNSHQENFELKTNFIVAMGLIVTLIMLGTAKLYNSVKTKPVSINIQKEQIATTKINPNVNYISTWHQLNLQNIDIEHIIHKNAIAKGKF